MYEARANCFPLNDGGQFTGENTTCELCEKIEEFLEHFLLEFIVHSDIIVIMIA